jgi:microcystin-dependent protein
MNFLLSKHWLCTALLGAIGITVAPKSALAGIDPYIGEIGWVAFNFAPRGWAFCNGQTLPIQQNQALFAVLGTTYGGNGQTTFMLPNLQGRGPIHVGTGHALGQMAGEENHTLTVNEIPSHTHLLAVDPKEATLAVPDTTTTSLAKTSSGASAYASTANVSMAATTIGPVGGNQAHTNMKPYIALNCIIALQGIFPSQN